MKVMKDSAAYATKINHLKVKKIITYYKLTKLYF